MHKVFTSVDQLIGGTPLLRLMNIEKAESLKAELYAKLEYFNPAGSVKDRVALTIIDDAEAEGRLQPGGTIIEPTSGNTGIGLAAIAAARGYRAVIVMPDSMSVERQLLMKAYGADLVLTPGAQGMAGAIAKAEELREEIPGSIIAGQFVNPANPKAHFQTTGPEIWDALEGDVDILVAGVGTGGTLTGTGEYLKSKDPSVRVVAVEPSDSPLLSGGQAGPHPLQGIGANFIPEVLNQDIIDEIITVSGPDAYAAANQLGHREGVLVGITAGAAIWAGIQLAKHPENEAKKIVIILPDTGERYLSTPGFIG